MSVNKLRSKTNFIPTSKKESDIMNQTQIPTKVQIKPFKSKNEKEKPRFNEELAQPKNPKPEPSMPLSLKTKKDLDQISKTSAKTTSTLKKSKFPSLKSVKSISHLSSSKSKIFSRAKSSSKNVKSKKLD